MEAQRRKLRFYRTADGKVVVEEWLASLRDARTRARLHIRLDRLEEGNLGDHRSVGGGVIELREHFGSGYRIYLGLDGERVIILLCAGDKSTQARDIRIAQGHWADYRAGKKQGGNT